MLSPETTLQDSEKLNGMAKHLPLSVSVCPLINPAALCKKEIANN